MRGLFACLVFAAISGCGKSQGGPDEGSTTGTTGAGASTTGAGASTTGAGASTTGAGASTGADSNTTDACKFTELTQCNAAALCPLVEVEDRPGPDAYADSELCAFAALRDRSPGLLEYNDCAGSGCSSLTLLILADRRVFGDFASFDAEVGTSMFGGSSGFVVARDCARKRSLIREGGARHGTLCTDPRRHRSLARDERSYGIGGESYIDRDRLRSRCEHAMPEMQ